MVSGKQVRLTRITSRGKMLCIPMDHSLTMGPVKGLERPEFTISQVARGGATAFLAHKGVIKSLRKPAKIGMILHLSASTSIGPAPNRKVLIASVEEGVRLGADAISIHVNIGCKEEPEMLQQLGSVADECDNLQMPFIAMMYPRGEGIKDPPEPDVVAHVARIGAEGGADIVKTVYTGSTETFREVVAKCPVPVVLAGGPKVGSDAELLRIASSVIEAGAMGVTFGRNVFQHSDPQAIVTALRRVVVQGERVEEAMGALRDVH
ncbi:MAG: 2-amino-3,7-dideoxy-D-threo-hept-6-ulosonate synthase [Nitrososphaerales archaeon]|nr:2-amino-3,7-dideoxy-D-threo-hept-6-ulosonate synthase [Nitrososphaerales archaeon]